MGGWGRREGRGVGVGGRVGGPSLPALLVVLSQSLRVMAAHLCEALGAGGGANAAHPAFLGGLDLCQNVPDLSLSQLEVQKRGGGGRERRGFESRTSVD